MVDLTSIGQTQAQRTGTNSTAQQSKSASNAEPKIETAVSSNDDQLHLTGQAQQINRIMAMLDKQPVVDSAKVQAASKAVLEGSLAVDPTSIAGKLANFENALKSISR